MRTTMPHDGGRSEATARALLLVAALIPAGCSADNLHGIDTLLPNSPFVTDSSIPKVDSSSSIPIILTSNKPDTVFTVNGHPFENAKMIKVLVPRSELRITAKAPCYRSLEQTASVEAFTAMSEFEFTFATWDKDSAASQRTCT
jgi:hypothetical protein